MIGLDTSAIIDLFKGDESIGKFFKKNKEPLATTIMSYLELSFGLNPEDREHNIEEQYYDEFFNDIFLIHLTKDSCKKASQIHWDLKKKGTTIDKFDCIIAATLVTHGIKKILTRNTKHFSWIKQLQVISY